jgi:hypothetical protein
MGDPFWGLAAISFLRPCAQQKASFNGLPPLRSGPRDQVLSDRRRFMSARIWAKGAADQLERSVLF